MNTAHIFSGGERLRTAALVFAAILASVLLGLRLGTNRQDVVGYGLQVPAPGLDLSYTYAMNRASAEGRAFGAEFVSTYGPFGFVIAAMDVPGIVTPWILSQLLLTIALGLAASLSARSVGGSPRAIAFATFFLLVFVHVLADEYRWLSLVLLLALLGLRARGLAGLWIVALAGFLAGFGLLVKLSLGSGALLTVVAAASLCRPFWAAVVRVALAGGSAAAGLGVGSWLHGGSIVGLADYVAAAASVTSGYSSAMSLAEPDWWKAAVSFGVFAACLATAMLAPARPHLRVVAAVLAAPLFVAWKHGIVRQDEHVETLVLFGLVLALLALLEIAGASGLRRAGPWLLLGGVALLRVWLESTGGRHRHAFALAETLLRPLALPGLAGLSTLTRLEAHRGDLERESAATLESQRLPDAPRRRVASQAVDVYPWESSYVAANHFNWHSRPSPASFATYTPLLDRQNAAFFERTSRPEFVVWHRSMGGRSIDKRHLFWDEPLTFRTLLDRYDLAWRGDVLLLQARPTPRFGPLERLQTVTVEWGQWLPLPHVRGGLLAEIEIDSPWPARVRRFLLREEAAFVAVRLTTGDHVRFRYVPDQARSGLWMRPLPRHAEGAAALFSGACPGNLVEEVSFLTFRPGAPGPRITFWRVPGAAGPIYDCGGLARTISRSPLDRAS
jgi:hypothetical protein